MTLPVAVLAVAVRRQLADFTLDLAFAGPADGVTILFGPSGAGKSATLAAVAGLAKAKAAQVSIGGDDLSRLPPERRGIGLVHQHAHLFPHLSVEGNLRYGLKRARGPLRIDRDAVIGVLAIGHLLTRFPRDLSGGERQRVALGRALLAQPRLLLLDEPVSALDAPRRAEILSYIAALKSRFALPMLYVTHNAAEARLLGDHLVRIDRGRVTEQGPLASLLPARALDGEALGAERVRIGGVEVAVPGIDAAPGTPVRISW